MNKRAQCDIEVLSMCVRAYVRKTNYIEINPLTRYPVIIKIFEYKISNDYDSFILNTNN